jgi:hypothetical protein
MSFALTGENFFGVNNEQQLTKNIEPKYIERFKNIITFISNYNNFQQHSKVEKLVKMDMNLPPQDIAFEQVSRILSNRSATSKCDSFAGMEPMFCTSSTTNPIVTVPDVMKIPMTPDANNNLSDKILLVIMRLSLRDKLLSSTTASDTSARDMHKEFFRIICLEIFKTHYKALFTNRVKYNFDTGLTVADLNDFQLTEILQGYYSVIETISIDVDGFNSNSYSNYYNIVCDEIVNYSKRQSNQLSNPIFYNMFLSCFYPYIQFSYIVGQIPMIESNTSIDKAPRYFILRRLAIAFSYIFEFYTVLTFYNSCSISSKVMAETILESINTCMTQEMISTSEKTYNDLHSDNLTNVETSKNLTNINRDITLSQNNLTKAIINETNIQSKYKNSFIIMWLWIALFIVFVVICAVFVIFLNNSNAIQYLYIASTLVAMAIFITIIVEMLN